MIEAEERVRTDAAFTGNHLLSTFAPEARALIESHGDMIELATGKTVLDQGDQVLATLFPFGPTMISMAVELSGGRSVEVALIGRRGAVGGIVSCGKAPAFTKAVVLVGGPAFRLPMEALESAKSQSPFIGNLFCRFSDYLLSQVMQSVACNVFHSIPQRAARWLLHAQDRTGDRIDLTQQALAGLLGVQRTTVNAVIQSLEQDGVIASGRGVVRVLDRAGLMHRSCECYQKLEDHFAAVIGTTGRGA
jgi:DNA-binding transcriptional regulator YhcF (GntR family)